MPLSFEVYGKIARPVAEVFGAVTDPRELSSYFTTGEVCAAFPRLDRCTVMQHLGVLERADLVVPRTQGRLRWNVLNVMPIMDIHERWIGPYAANAARLLARLRNELEREGLSAARSAPGRAAG